MSKNASLQLAAVILLTVTLGLIGIPGVFQGFGKFKKGVIQLEFKLEKLADGSYLARLSDLKKNTVPVFNLSSATYKIDFASLSELAENVYYLGAVIIDPKDGSELKVLEKRTKVNGKKKFIKVAAIGANSLYTLSNANLKNIQPEDLTLAVADLLIFQSSCYQNLVVSSSLDATCPEINFNLPYRIEYFESDPLLEAYIISTDDSRWLELGIYSSPIEITYGQGKAKKTLTQSGVRKKVKAVSLRKGMIETVGTFTILPEEIMPDMQIEINDPIIKS